MKTIVFDLEIQKRIARSRDKATDEDHKLVEEGLAVYGWGEAHTAGISSAVACHVEADRYHIFGDKLYEHINLVDLICSADRVVGYNHWCFDYPLLSEASGIELYEITDLDADPGVRDWDLLQMIWGGIGKRDFAKGNGLDAVTLATLGKEIGGKTGDGAKAPELYQAGRYGELLDYNLRDVDLTQRLYHFIMRYKQIVNGAGKAIPTAHPPHWF